MLHLEDLLGQHRRQARNCLIITETVFSMDGDMAPLDEICALAGAHDAWTMSDDAHGLGIVDYTAKTDVQMGTLSKTLGSAGGYVCAAQPVIDLLKSRARSFVYSTGLPPASVAAALAALEIIEAHPALGRQAVAKAKLFAQELNLPVPRSTIVPVLIGDAAAALDLSARPGSGGISCRCHSPTDGAVRHGAGCALPSPPAHGNADIIAVAGMVRESLYRNSYLKSPLPHGRGRPAKSRSGEGEVLLGHPHPPVADATVPSLSYEGEG